MKAVFLRALEADDKASALRAAIHEPAAALGRGQRFDVDPACFAAVPRSPLAYWVSERLRGLFKALPPFESDGRTLSFGASTKNDFRFVRSSFEVPLAVAAGSLSDTGRRPWVPLAKEAGSRRSTRTYIW